MKQNSFALSQLALCVGLALSPMAAMSAVQTDDRTQAVKQQQQQQSHYVVILKEKSAWQAGGDARRAHDSNRDVVNFINGFDNKSQTTASSHKLVNTVQANLSPEALLALQNHPLVASVTLATPADRQSTLPQVTTAASKADMSKVLSSMAPLMSDDPEAGLDIKVAVLSTGIDYTHAMLGGDGSNYQEAEDNAAGPYEGFPTDLVVAGQDFLSEAGWGSDANPLDKDDEYVHWNGYVFPTGRGTALASIVHQLAPGAKLMAYKIASTYVNQWDGNTYMQFAGVTTMAEAMEKAVEDGADVILLDHQAYGFDFAAYIDPSDDQPSPGSLTTLMMQSAAAQGVIVVGSAGGSNQVPTKYNASWLTASDDVIAVGAVDADGETLVTTPWSPHGPVRGSQTIKPDLVGHYAQMDVAEAGSGDGMDQETVPDFASARVAAAAAIVAAARPELSNIEVKALLTNTANGEVLRGGTSQNASVTQIGGGVVQVENAVNSPIAAWEKGSYQPHLRFGHQVHHDTTRVVKEITLRNYSDTTQTYSVEVMAAEGRDGNAALSWSHPDSVSIPPKSVITIPMVVEIDPSKLPDGHINMTDDFTIENWEKYELNGYVVLTQEDQPQVHLAWAMLPRYQGELTRNFATYEELFESPNPIEWAEQTDGRKMSVVNTGSKPMTLQTTPLMHSRINRPQDKLYTNNLLKHVGGGIYDEAMCTSGKKMKLYAQMQGPMDLAVSNHGDKIGNDVVIFSAYHQDAIEKFQFDNGVYDPSFIEDSDYQFRGWVGIDTDGKPYTIIIDLTIPYDPNNPFGRYQYSSLPTYFAPGGDTVVGQFCLEDAYHHDIDSPEDFDQDLGWIWATDRDAFPNINTPIIRYNPIKHGRQLVSVGQDWFGNEFEIVNNTTVDLHMNRVDSEGVEDEAWAADMVVQPGEEVMVYAMKDAYCSDWGGNCFANEFMLYSVDANYSQWGEVQPRYGIVASVMPNQSFSVQEGSAAGTVIGQIEATAPGFFAIGAYDEESYSSMSFLQVSAIPGDAIRVEQSGAVVVHNPDALDFESGITELTVRVQTRQGNTISAVEDVVISITDVNDVAPAPVMELEDATVGHDGEVSISIAGLFADAEGDNLTISVDGLPEGVLFNQETMMLEGKPTAAGEYLITVTANDGVNSTSTEMTLTVEEAPAPAPAPAPEPAPSTSSSSGGLGFALPLLAWLGWRRRR